MKYGFVLFFLLILVIGLLSGCGGGDGDEEPQPVVHQANIYPQLPPPVVVGAQ